MAVSRALRKRLRALTRRKERRRSGLLLAEGPRVVGDLLNAEATVHECLFTAESSADPSIASLVDRLRASGARCVEVPVPELAEFSDTVTPQGLLVVAAIPAAEWRDIRNPRLLVVDGVQDPGNLGTMIRTAEALGVGGVIILPGTVDPWAPKSLRAASGSSFRLPVLESGHGATIAELERRDIPIWVAAAEGDPLGRRERGPERVALVVGNEGAGVSGRIRDAAQRIVAIEQAADAESLNVAVAAAILLDRILGGDGAGSA